MGDVAAEIWSSVLSLKFEQEDGEKACDVASGLLRYCAKGHAGAVPTAVIQRIVQILSSDVTPPPVRVLFYEVMWFVAPHDPRAGAALASRAFADIGGAASRDVVLMGVQTLGRLPASSVLPLLSMPTIDRTMCGILGPDTPAMLRAAATPSLLRIVTRAWRLAEDGLVTSVPLSSYPDARRVRQDVRDKVNEVLKTVIANTEDASDVVCEASIEGLAEVYHQYFRMREAGAHTPESWRALMNRITRRLSGRLSFLAARFQALGPRGHASGLVLVTAALLDVLGEGAGAGNSWAAPAVLRLDEVSTSRDFSAVATAARAIRDWIVPALHSVHPVVQWSGLASFAALSSRHGGVPTSSPVSLLLWGDGRKPRAWTEGDSAVPIARLAHGTTLGLLPALLPAFQSAVPAALSAASALLGSRLADSDANRFATLSRVVVILQFLDPDSASVAAAEFAGSIARVPGNELRQRLLSFVVDGVVDRTVRSPHSSSSEPHKPANTSEQDAARAPNAASKRRHDSIAKFVAACYSVASKPIPGSLPAAGGHASALSGISDSFKYELSFAAANSLLSCARRPMLATGPTTDLPNSLQPQAVVRSPGGELGLQHPPLTARSDDVWVLESLGFLYKSVWCLFDRLALRGGDLGPVVLSHEGRTPQSALRPGPRAQAITSASRVCFELLDTLCRLLGHASGEGASGPDGLGREGLDDGFLDAGIPRRTIVTSGASGSATEFSLSNDEVSSKQSAFQSPGGMSHATAASSDTQTSRISLSSRHDHRKKLQFILGQIAGRVLSMQSSAVKAADLQPADNFTLPLDPTAFRVSDFQLRLLDLLARYWEGGNHGDRLPELAGFLLAEIGVTIGLHSSFSLPSNPALERSRKCDTTSSRIGRRGWRNKTGRPLGSASEGRLEVLSSSCPEQRHTVRSPFAITFVELLTALCKRSADVRAAVHSRVQAVVFGVSLPTSVRCLLLPLLAASAPEYPALPAHTEGHDSLWGLNVGFVPASVPVQPSRPPISRDPAKASSTFGFNLGAPAGTIVSGSSDPVVCEISHAPNRDSSSVVLTMTVTNVMRTAIPGLRLHLGVDGAASFANPSAAGKSSRWFHGAPSGSEFRTAAHSLQRPLPPGASVTWSEGLSVYGLGQCFVTLRCSFRGRDDTTQIPESLVVPANIRRGLGATWCEDATDEDDVVEEWAPADAPGLDWSGGGHGSSLSAASGQDVPMWFGADLGTSRILRSGSSSQRPTSRSTLHSLPSHTRRPSSITVASSVRDGHSTRDGHSIRDGASTVRGGDRDGGGSVDTGLRSETHGGFDDQGTVDFEFDDNVDNRRLIRTVTITCQEYLIPLSTFLLPISPAHSARSLPGFSRLWNRCAHVRFVDTMSRTFLSLPPKRMSELGWLRSVIRPFSFTPVKLPSLPSSAKVAILAFVGQTWPGSTIAVLVTGSVERAHFQTPPDEETDAALTDGPAPSGSPPALPPSLLSPPFKHTRQTSDDDLLGLFGTASIKSPSRPPVAPSPFGLAAFGPGSAGSLPPQGSLLSAAVGPPGSEPLAWRVRLEIRSDAAHVVDAFAHDMQGWLDDFAGGHLLCLRQYGPSDTRRCQDWWGGMGPDGKPSGVTSMLGIRAGHRPTRPPSGFPNHESFVLPTPSATRTPSHAPDPTAAAPSTPSLESVFGIRTPLKAPHAESASAHVPRTPPGGRSPTGPQHHVGAATQPPSPDLFGLTTRSGDEAETRVPELAPSAASHPEAKPATQEQFNPDDDPFAGLF